MPCTCGKSFCRTLLLRTFPRSPVTLSKSLALKWYTLSVKSVLRMRTKRRRSKRPRSKRPRSKWNEIQAPESQVEWTPSANESQVTSRAKWIEGQLSLRAKWNLTIFCIYLWNNIGAIIARIQNIVHHSLNERIFLGQTQIWMYGWSKHISSNSSIAIAALHHPDSVLISNPRECSPEPRWNSAVFCT